MSSSTFMTFLMHFTDSGYEKLADIKDFSDIFGESELLEITSFTDKAQVFTTGIRTNDGKVFTVNYDKTFYEYLKQNQGKEDSFSIWFGGIRKYNGELVPTGSEGRFDFRGFIYSQIKGAGVNDIRDIGVVIVPTSPVFDNKDVFLITTTKYFLLNGYTWYWLDIEEEDEIFYLTYEKYDGNPYEIILEGTSYVLYKR